MDLPPSAVDLLAKSSIEIGNVYRIKMDPRNGITPKNPGDTFRNKFFIVLGFDSDDIIYGGVVINSEINPGVNPGLRDYHIPIQRIHYPFLNRDSFVDCSDVKIVDLSNFKEWAFLGHLMDVDVDIIKDAVAKCPAISKATLIRFNLL